MLQMATISKILKEHFVNGKSPHQISQEFEVSWATVNGYLKKNLKISRIWENDLSALQQWVMKKLKKK